jgi:hypothetical protein
VAQEVSRASAPNKHEALSSNPVLPKKRKNVEGENNKMSDSMSQKTLGLPDTNQTPAVASWRGRGSGGVLEARNP